jgi:hypothetical protein
MLDRLFTEYLPGIVFFMLSQLKANIPFATQKERLQFFYDQLFDNPMLIIIPLHKLLGGVLDLPWIYGCFPKTDKEKELTRDVKELHLQRFSLMSKILFCGAFNVDLTKITPGSYTGLYANEVLAKIMVIDVLTVPYNKKITPERDLWPALRDIVTHNRAVPWGRPKRGN